MARRSDWTGGESVRARMTASELRSIAAGIAGTAAFGAALNLLEAADAGRTDQLAVLTYHRVGDDADEGGPGLYPGLVSATASELDAQLTFLTRHYTVISLDDLFAARHGDPLPRRAVLLTFDDAYTDFGDVAWPVLRRHRVPVTLFVPTAFPRPETPGFWWDWLYAAVETVEATQAHRPLRVRGLELPIDGAVSRREAFRQLRTLVKGLPHDEGMAVVADVARVAGVSAPTRSVLSWDALRSLAAQGVTLAPHSRTHPLLTRVDAERLADELAGSLDDLRSEIGDCLPVVAYPSGDWSRDVVAAAETAGYEIGFTTKRGLIDLRRADWLSLRRINVGGRTSLNVLRAQVGRWASLWSD
ncbi:MAG TPA: polysaccharide deacetylase family protein [Candidatus Limnocylindria bacterium]|jgi:peptidoglycan/xylan/chitin deacetylase (PgdA/CDA1 family)